MSTAVNKEKAVEDRFSSERLKSMVIELSESAHLRADKEASRNSGAMSSSDEYLLDLKRKVVQVQADLDTEQKELKARLEMIAAMSEAWQSTEASIDALVADRDRWAAQVNSLGTQILKQRTA